MQILFRVCPERLHAVLGTEEVLVPLVHDAPGRIGGIDLHAADRINSWCVFFHNGTLGIHDYILATILPRLIAAIADAPALSPPPIYDNRPTTEIRRR